jgi:RimJ/RimL family protein N-acetyltransferase
LETERLILRRFTVADVDHLYALDNDPEVMRWLNGGEPVTRDEIAGEIMPDFVGESEGRGLFGYWAAFEKASRAFAGWLSLRQYDGASPADAWLGYRFVRAMWGMGYATEGSRLLIARAFAEMGVQRVLATTYEHNAASRRVMEKLGMRHVRSFRLTPDDLANATFHSESQEVWDGDEVEYTITKAEWERAPFGRRRPSER